MDRFSLDTFAARRRLSPHAVEAALSLTALRPSATDWRTFAATLSHAAGLAAIGAGALFFVAANWQEFGVLGRFALLQAGLVVCVAVALWCPPPSPGREIAQPTANGRVGQAALVLATLLVGGLLALFGQSYQTGADVYELFGAWALLALPFALAGHSGALWAVWFTVLNCGLALLCGWTGPDHFVWRLLGGRDVDRALLLMLPCLINLLAAGMCVALQRTRFVAAAPAWLARFLASLGFLYGTGAALSVVTGGFGFYRVADDHGQGDAAVLLFAAISAGTALATLRAKRDVFPMALIAACWIAISTTWLALGLRFGDIGAFFLIAFWLIGASSATSVLLMRWTRAWNATPIATVDEGATA